MSILVVMQQRGGEWNRMSFETLAAAQQLADDHLNKGRGRDLVGIGAEVPGGWRGDKAAEMRVPDRRCAGAKDVGGLQLYRAGPAIE